MKKLSLLLAITLLLALLSTAVAADNDYDLKTNVSGVLSDDKSVYRLSVSLDEIKDESGISFIEYAVKFDSTVFKLKNADVKVPDIWKEHLDSEMAESLSRQINDNEYSWIWVMALEGHGVKENGQLVLELEFEVLKEAKSDINVSCIDILSDKLVNLKANSVSVSVDTANVGNEDINSDASVIEPDYSTPAVSQEPSADFEYSDVSDSVIQLPTVSSVVNTSESTSGLDNISSDNGNTVLYVILGSLGAVAVVVCVIVLIKRRSSVK